MGIYASRLKDICKSLHDLFASTHSQGELVKALVDKLNEISSYAQALPKQQENAV